MKTNIRFAGAQIPCTQHIAQNVSTIKAAIDWAADNTVDYLVTPEGSLSGYNYNFSIENYELISALAEIEQYAANKNVGLCLGTLWDELEFNGRIRRNQIRFYKNDGKFLGIVNKHITIEQDEIANVISDNNTLLIGLLINNQIIPAGGLICVDMYGTPDRKSIPTELSLMGARILIHATNGNRNNWQYDRSKTELADNISNDWHDICMRRTSFLRNLPIITVDNCYMCDGTEYHGRTSSESGVIIGGEWVTQVPRTGTQYFYYDFDVDTLAIDMPPPPLERIDNVD